MRIASMFALAALCGGFLLAEPALAKSSARAPLTPVASGVLDGTRVRVRIDAKSHGRAELRVEVERAATDLVLNVWFADSTGTMVLAGPMRPDAQTPGEYRYRVRTQKGQALPAGATTLDELAGRAIEIRDGNGTVVASGATPATGGTKSSGGGGSGSGGGNSGGGGGGGRGRGGADDPANHQ